MTEYFKNEQEIFEHLINGGSIRPHFITDATNKKRWIHLNNGNRTYCESGESAANCLLSPNYWIKADT